MPIDLSTIFCLLLIVMSVIFTIKSSVLGLTICAIATLILHSIALDPAIDPTPIVVLSVLMTIFIHLYEKYDDGSKVGSYKKYAKMGLISDEGVVIGQYDTILSGVVPPLTKILPADKWTAAYNWFVERHMNPMPLY